MLRLSIFKLETCNLNHCNIRGYLGIVVMKLFQLIGLALVLRLYQEHRTQLVSVCVAIG